MTLFEPPTGQGWHGYEPVPLRPPRRRGGGRALVIVLVGLALAVAGGLWAMEQSGGMPWARTAPTAEVVALADRVQLTDTGRDLLYSLRPELADAEAVAEACGGAERVAPGSAPDGETTPLGCYVRSFAGRHIVLYNPRDERLAGMVVTTAAHELLHAVYDALPASEQSRIDALMELELARVPVDDPVRRQIDSSVGSHDSSVGTERFAYLGSQIELEGGFAPELEKLYARYFVDRAALVAVFRQTDAVVHTVIGELDTDWAALAAEEQAGRDARATFESDLASHRADLAAYEEELARFEALPQQERAQWTVTRTAPDGSSTTLGWEQSLAQWRRELDAAAAELAARGPSLDTAEEATAVKRAALEEREQDAVALVEAAYPGTDLK
ncbi:hypothetical protein [Microbacterium sp. BK668]|uniref:hypothetical protein n=1 Tax=Microbacterium sp. BK668 TaxID=2512118 RepID=UPI00105E7378|nr:hypothetical protein [Microbacterium sp. BK668]TDN91463.1 hypothetical protein EV279_0962 [Microbacterium sp. BK668]